MSHSPELTDSVLDDRTRPVPMLNRTLLGLPWRLWLLMVISLLAAHRLDVLPPGIVSGLAVMFGLGAVFGEIGNRLPVWNRYVGGARC